MDEPVPSAPTPRPCSIPHSAPVEWLKAAAAAVPPHPDALRAAIEVVLGSADAVAEVIARAPPAAFPLPPDAARHDGWTGERMATFLEVLADTGIVSEAARIAGMSREAAYALRGRDPVFGAAWAAAQARARPVVGDGLLERSITGTVEHYYRDGVLVGERRHYESWLALAVLKRLDRQAEQDRADGALSARIADDWQAALAALREGGSGAVAALLEPEADKADTPPSPPGCDLSESVWRAGSEEDPAPNRERGVPAGSWVTTFPPPPGFAGYETGRWDGYAWYERSCTSEEIELIEAHQRAAEAAELAELTADAEAERDSYFAKLRAELAALANPASSEPAPAEGALTAAATAR